MGVSKKHTHKYAKVDLSFGKVWRCLLPECNHYMPQHMEELVNGRHSVCNSCGARFILNPLNMQDDTPECDECRLGSVGELPVSQILADKIKDFTEVK